MTMLQRQINRARRRLTTNVLLHWAALGVICAAGAWVLVLLVERAFVIGIPVMPGVWAAVIVAAVIAAVGTFLAAARPLQAAAALDQAGGFKERASTALALLRADDPFAQATIRDAEEKIGRLHVPALMPVRAPVFWPWAAAAIATAALLGFFMPELNLLKRADAATNQQASALAALERENINVELQDRINRIKELAENNPDLKDLAKELEPLEMPDSPAVTPEDVRRDALKKLDKINDKLAEQKEEAGLDALRDTQRMLSRLEAQQGDNPSSELSKSLASGDFKGAKEALEKLQEEVKEAVAKGDEQSQQQLAQMEQQLKRLADQLAELDDTTYLQKELENKAGLNEEQAKKLAEQLANMDPKQLEKQLQQQLGEKGLSQEQIEQLAKKIQKQQEAKKQCQNMGQCLSQAAQALQQCQSPGQGAGAAQSAAAALSDALGQMSDLEMAEAMLNELEASMADLQDLRQGVCEGGFGPGNRPDSIGNQGPNYGQGIGARIGKEATPHDVTPTKAKSRIQGGTIIGQMLVDGPQRRGEATAEEQEAVVAAQRDAQDAIDQDRVPRQYHNAVQAYFEQLAGVLKKPAEGAAPPAP